MICDNNKNILAISECINGNHHDSYNLVPIVKKMFKSLKKTVKIKKGIYFNADSGFDTKDFRAYLTKEKMIPNIKNNKRNSKKE